MNKKKPIILVTAILLAAITAVSAATFAWFTAQDEVVNRITTAKLSDGDVSIIETFDPTDKLEPGVDINKDVGVINTGDAPALVRVSFIELLKKLRPMNADAALARKQDMQVRSDTKFVSATAPDVDKFIPQLVDISKFADQGWDELASFTDFTDYGFKLLDQDSEDNLQALFTKGIIFQVKQTQGDPLDDDAVPPKTAFTTGDKFSFSAYAKLTSNPDTYQRVELRPELLDMVRQNDPLANLDGGARDEANQTIYKEYGLQVVLTDPTNTLYQDETPVAGDPAAIGNNGAGRFYNFITLELANGGNGYEADWRVGGVAGEGTHPVGDTHPVAGDYNSSTKTKNNSMPAVTNKGNLGSDGKYILELMFHNGNIASTPTADMWYYNANDGFFYFCGVVEPGQTTPLLLDAIALSGAAESDYSHTEFNLTVYMDGIQATAEAVTSTVGGGWGLNTFGGTGLGDISNTALAAFLKSICPTA